MAAKIVNADSSIFESRRIGSKLERRVMLNRVIADASYVMSLLCFELVKCFFVPVILGFLTK